MYDLTPVVSQDVEFDRLTVTLSGGSAGALYGTYMADDLCEHSSSVVSMLSAEAKEFFAEQNDFSKFAPKSVAKSRILLDVRDGIRQKGGSNSKRYIKDSVDKGLINYVIPRIADEHIELGDDYTILTLTGSGETINGGLWGEDHLVAFYGMYTDPKPFTNYLSTIDIPKVIKRNVTLSVNDLPKVVEFYNINKSIAGEVLGMTHKDYVECIAFPRGAIALDLDGLTLNTYNTLETGGVRVIGSQHEIYRYSPVAVKYQKTLEAIYYSNLSSIFNNFSTIKLVILPSQGFQNLAE